VFRGQSTLKATATVNRGGGYLGHFSSLLWGGFLTPDLTKERRERYAGRGKNKLPNVQDDKTVLTHSRKLVMFNHSFSKRGGRSFKKRGIKEARLFVTEQRRS